MPGPTGSRGAGVDPYIGRNVTTLLDERVSSHPDKELLVWRDDEDVRRWTYAEFEAEVARVAGGLLERGIRAGDFVAICSENAPEVLLTWFAAQRLGAVMVATNSRSAPDELAHYLGRTRSRLVVTQPRLLPTVTAAVAALGGGVRIVVTEPPDGRGGAKEVDGVEPFGRLGQGRPAAAAAVASSDLAGVQFTSGTTARPKGVMWTHANFLWAGQVSAAHERLRADDRHLTFLPLFHANAQAHSVMATLWVGGTLILVPRFSARRFWPVALEERATWCSLIPFAVRALKAFPVPSEHQFRHWGSGVLVPSWDRHFGVTTIGWWGMTETVAQPIVSDPDRAVRAMAIGTAATEYEVRLVDEERATLSPPATGLLEVRGRRGVSMALGYLDDDTATQGAWDDDGWFRTGDRVEIHADGWVTFVERDKDMLKVGGENVAALEIEQVISKVSGVREVAVVGVADAMLGDLPVAYVVADPADRDGLPAAVVAACRDRLADFKVPHHVFCVDDLPRGTLEKVAKAVLRARATEELEHRRTMREDGAACPPGPRV